MRFKNTLDTLLGQKSKIKLLRFLIKTPAELTGREIARATGMDHKTSHRALKEFSAQGVVLISHVGGSTLYKLNKNNYLIKTILKRLFLAEKSLLNAMAKTLIKKINLPMISVVIFGSLARGEERATSDIDSLIIVKDMKIKEKIIQKLEQIEISFISEFGNMLSPIIITVSELKKRIRGKNKLIREILQTGIIVYGKSIKGIKSLAR